MQEEEEDDDVYADRHIRVISLHPLGNRWEQAVLALQEELHAGQAEAGGHVP